MSRFSIIVPVYNVEKYLHECVRSVLGQTFSDFELILVDDGSTDSCPQICDQYAAADSRVRVIHKQNGGLSSARNDGLDKAVGEYILFLDSDDYWCDPNALEIINGYIARNPSDIFIFGRKKFFQNKNEYIEYSPPFSDGRELSQMQGKKFLMEENIFIACACDKVVNRKVIEKNGIRFTANQLSEDIEWCIQLLLHVRSMGVIPQCFYVYRQQNATSITANISRKNLKDILQVIETYSKYNDEDLKHFIANQYILWMTTANRVPQRDIKDLIKTAKQYWFLLKYNRYPYVRQAARLKFIGFHGVKLLLGLYRKARQ